MFNLAVIGDIHRHFDDVDVASFNESDYALLLFVGDLCRFVSPKETLAVASRLAKLAKPAILIPGNHDVANVVQFLAALRGMPRLARLSGRGHRLHHERLREALGPVMLGGYSRHGFEWDGFALDVIVARPYAMGGSQLSFAPFLAREFGIRTPQQSAARLKQLVDESSASHLVFLAHNGPFGLGDRPEDAWGCDFDPELGDFGDRDLAEAIAHAKVNGKEVVAVAAGHMHRLSKSGRHRTWHTLWDGTHYINAAQVPRIFQYRGGTVRHHVCVSVAGGSVTVEDRLL